MLSNFVGNLVSANSEEFDLDKLIIRKAIL
jgi:hypothetical protein